jgi:hypothetical protein
LLLMLATKPMPHASRSNSGEYNPMTFFTILNSNIRRYSKKYPFN